MTVTPLLASAATALAPLVGVEAATAAGGSSAFNQLMQLFLANTAANLTDQAARSGIGAITAATAPGEISPVSVGPNKSNYFLGSAPYFQQQQTEFSENFKRKLLNHFLAEKDQLPAIPSAQEVYKTLQDTAEAQATSLSLREQALAKLKGEIAYRKEQMERQFDQSIAGLQGQYKVENTKQEQIGQIEKQRVASEYGAAGGMLNSAIANVFSQVPYSDSPILRQIAVPV
ncbi:MAG: hypothetical protein EBU08_09815 [Micrococcales bacterium]|nr:hypothetical protein [Micrococcales bacterium]